MGFINPKRGLWVSGPPAAGAAFNPLTLNPSLWLDAQKAGSVHVTGGKVTQWDDQSVNGFNCVQATGGKQPASPGAGIHGHPTVSFSQADPDSVTMTGGSPGPNWQQIIGPGSVYTFFLVWLYTGSITRTGDPELNDPNIFTDFAGNGPWNGATAALHAAASPTVDVSTFCYNNSAYVNATVSGLVANAHYSTHQYDGTLLKVALEQGAFTTATLGGAGFVGTSATPVAAGGNSRGNTPAWQGEIGEIFVCPSVLSGANILLMQQYLSTKWGI